MVKAAPHIHPPPSLSTLEEAVTGPSRARPQSCYLKQLIQRATLLVVKQKKKNKTLSTTTKSE